MAQQQTQALHTPSCARPTGLPHDSNPNTNTQQIQITKNKIPTANFSLIQEQSKNIMTHIRHPIGSLSHCKSRNKINF